MTPEQEIAADLLDGAQRLVVSAEEVLALIARPPENEAAFLATTGIERVALTAMLKQFEQLEGALHGLFRAMLRITGVRLKGLQTSDIANRMRAFGVIDDPDQWVAIVNLRNQLAHEYPVGSAEQLERVLAAHAAFPSLFDATKGAARIIREHRLLDEPA